MSTTAPNSMIAQVESLPELFRNEIKALDERVRRLLDHEECLSVKRVVTTGCGDSFMASVATELAFEQIARIPAEPLTSMQMRYAVPYWPADFPRNPLVLGTSVSGTVSRTQEAIKLARSKGALTVGITANPTSPLGQVVEKVLDCTVPEFEHAPGVRSYRVSLLVLYLLAIRLGEVRDLYSQDEANAMRQELVGIADAIEATIEAVRDRTRELAERYAGEKSFVFTGDGPNYATALFGAAKVIEAAGRHAMGQDTEEWAHLQYFTSIETGTPTFMISPGYRGHDRAAELFGPLGRIGREVVAIVPEGDEVVAPKADWVLPVAGQVREAFTPLVYPVATELFAAYLSDVTGERFFRAGNPAYSDGNEIRTSQIAEDTWD